MVMVPDKYPEFFNLLRELVQENRVPMSRIDDAVTRILGVKIAMGLMNPNRRQLADRSLRRNFGSVEHRAVARACVRESMVLLKNNNGALPLKHGIEHIHVGGRSADNIGNQCGGWTIYWQGKSGDVTRGTTILAALRKGAPSGTKITYAEDGSGGKGASIGLAIIGETPYAEMMGDREDLRISVEGVRVVVVLVSGRPLIIDSILPMADAVIAAWLPGTEGDGVADVLYRHKPTGKLSFSWPAGSATSFHIGDPGYRALFDFRYGLTYG